MSKEGYPPASSKNVVLMDSSAVQRRDPAAAGLTMLPA